MDSTKYSGVKSPWTLKLDRQTGTVTITMHPYPGRRLVSPGRIICEAEAIAESMRQHQPTAMGGEDAT